MKVSAKIGENTELLVKALKLYGYIKSHPHNNEAEEDILQETISKMSVDELEYFADHMGD